MFVLPVAKLLFNHIWDVLKDVPSFQSEYGVILRHLLQAQHYQFHIRKRVYSSEYSYCLHLFVYALFMTFMVYAFFCDILLFCFNLSDLVLLYMEKVETSLDMKTGGHLNPREEVFRCILTLQSLLENPPGDFPADLREDVVKGFIGILSHIR